MRKLIVYSLTFILCLLFIFNTTSFASDIKDYFMPGSSHSDPDFEEVSSDIYAVIKAVGIVIIACLSAVFGITFMISSPQKQAELKGRLIYYLGGIILLFAMGPILSLLEKIIKSFFP